MLPSYTASLEAARNHLRECENQITNERDYATAMMYANSAQLAVSLLLVDLELTLRDTPPRKVIMEDELPEEPPKVEEPPKKKAKSYKPDDEVVAEWVKEQWGLNFHAGTELQQRGWRANYVIQQRRKEVA